MEVDKVNFSTKSLQTKEKSIMKNSLIFRKRCSTKSSMTWKSIASFCWFSTAYWSGSKASSPESLAESWQSFSWLCGIWISVSWHWLPSSPSSSPCWTTAIHWSRSSSLKRRTGVDLKRSCMSKWFRTSSMSGWAFAEQFARSSAAEVKDQHS